MTSVTRFGENSTLWQNIRSLWAILVWFIKYLCKRLYVLRQFLKYLVNLYCCKWPQIEKQSRRLVTLQVTFKPTWTIWAEFKKENSIAFKVLDIWAGTLVQWLWETTHDKRSRVRIWHRILDGLNFFRWFVVEVVLIVWKDPFFKKKSWIFYWWAITN